MLGTRSGAVRVFVGLSAALLGAVAQEVPPARYPGSAIKASRQQTQALPPGYAQAQQQAAWQLAPLSAGERARVHTRALPQKGVRRSVPQEAFGNAIVSRLPDGRRTWRTRIASPGAQAVRVHFRNFAGAGGQLWTYGDRAQIEGPFSGAGPFGDGDFWTASIASEAITVEYVEAAPNAAQQFPPFTIDSIVHIWDDSAAAERAQELTARPASLAGRPRHEAKASSGGAQVASCHLDVSCYSQVPNLLQYASAIAQLDFLGDDGSYYVCSGSMINTRNNSFKPYLLTAHHCISSASEVKSLVARFQYQTASCGAKPPSIYSVPSVSGGQYLAGAPIEQGDYSLVLLNDAPPAGTYFLGWNQSSSALAMGGSATGIHHPDGSWKRVSFGTRVADDAADVGGEYAPSKLYYQVRWDQGKTEGGSSGSPLIDSTGAILGTLTYGPLIPPGSTVCDIDPEVSGYARFSNAYPAIQPFLDDAAAPSITVTPNTLSFSVVNGQVTSAASQTLTIKTPSTTALPFSLTTSAPWIRLSAASGAVSSSSPASVSVTVDPSAFSTTSTANGTIMLSSGTMMPLQVSVQVAATVSQSNVEITVDPNPVYAQTPDADGFAWFFKVTLQEKSGVPGAITSFKIAGSDYSANIRTWFGSDQLPAWGTLTTNLRSKNIQVPASRVFEAGGVDTGSQRSWTAQVQVSFLAQPVTAILSLDSAPSVIRQDPAAADCQWYQQLILQETGGIGVTLTSFKASDIDLSSSIADYWGTATLPASGTLIGGICWTGIRAPDSITVEVGGTDSKGNPVTVRTSGTFSGPAAQATTMSVSDTAVDLPAAEGYTTTPSSKLDLSLGSTSAAWTGRVVFSSTSQSDWLTVSPLSGSGSTTLQIAAADGVPKGTYKATLVLTSIDAVPALINVPIKLSIDSVPTTEIAEMLSPEPGSTLAGAEATFSWTRANDAVEYVLYVGTAQGGNDLASIGAGSSLSATAAGLPADGRTLYVRLWTHLPTAWRYNDYVYTASGAGGSTQAEMTSPAPDSTLSGAVATFSWTRATGALDYVLFVGTAVGKNDLASLGAAGLSLTVTGLPADGRTLYVRLWTHQPTAWLYKDYVYTASSTGGGSVSAVMTSPVPGSALTGAVATFSWTPAAGALDYVLFVGTSVGKNDLASLGASGVSITLTGLPADGRTLFVRLWTHQPTAWLYNDYVYIASRTGGGSYSAEMTSPAPGSTLSGSRATFSWTKAAGALDYVLFIGTAVGKNDLASVGAAGASIAVTGLPADGRTLYVRLWTHLPTAWVYNDYVYKAGAVRN